MASPSSSITSHPQKSLSRTLKKVHIVGAAFCSCIVGTDVCGKDGLDNFLPELLDGEILER